MLGSLLSTSEALAHPEGFSGLHVTVSPEKVRASITVHTRDMDVWFPPGKYPDYVADVIREMERTVDEIIEVHLDGQPLSVDQVNAFLLEVGLIEIDVDYTLVPNSHPTELLVWSKHLIWLPRGHQQLLFIEDRRQTEGEEETGIMRLEDILTVDRDAGAVMIPVMDALASPPLEPESLEEFGQDAPVPTASMDGGKESTVDSRRPKASPASEQVSSRISFFLFGVEHIITGYDHLLFLAALLLTCTTFSEAAAIVTCFTIAHSITLALAALNVVRLPSEIVEPLIALSIVYVAVENLTGASTLFRRAAVTFCFGLIHGLGFASALRDIGLGTIPGGVVWPLFRFNLGVEAGQLCVAAVFLPLIFALQRNEQWTKRLVTTGSLLVALLGGYWFVTRVMSQWLYG